MTHPSPARPSAVPRQTVVLVKTEPVGPVLTDAEREAVLWAIGVGYRVLDDGFSFPRDQNRAVLESARAKLTEGDDHA